jgi:hypothetical protein
VRHQEWLKYGAEFTVLGYGHWQNMSATLLSLGCPTLKTLLPEAGLSWRPVNCTQSFGNGVFPLELPAGQIA